MPSVKVIFYREDDGTVPLLKWLDGLIVKAQDKCRVRLERLEELGYELRRPEGDYLRDDIYELRASHLGVNYRMLYFFYRTTTVVISHGLVKERVVPMKEIDLAIRRRRKFLQDPERHTYEEMYA